MLGKPKAVHAQDGALLVYQTFNVYIEYLAENVNPDHPGDRILFCILTVCYINN